ncbi:hypothetical protein [Natronorarus salvus]|uniref:hypothetical protein n=1 Tax=Natronorarus salvus TaxID=3117733 RepID=UPI002F266308
MNRYLVFYGAFAVIGVSLGWMGVSGVLAGEVSIGAVLVTISGVGIVLAAVYEVARSDRTTGSVPDQWTYRIVVLGAVLAVLGVTLRTVSVAL